MSSLALVQKSCGRRLFPSLPILAVAILTILTAAPAVAATADRTEAKPSEKKKDDLGGAFDFALRCDRLCDRDARSGEAGRRRCRRWLEYPIQRDAPLNSPWTVFTCEPNRATRFASCEVIHGM
jgi:hypothetical protein